MRIAACLLAALCAMPVALAQGVIEWSAQRRLSRADFKGRVPMSTSPASMSALNIDATWQCQGGELSGTARATFDPARSWWRSTNANVWEDFGERRTGVERTHIDVRRTALHRDARLLEHEQLHFDLTEIAARKIRRRFDDLKESCSGDGGDGAVKDAVSQIERELEEEQRRYDRETAHGSNEVAQAQWTDRVRKLIQ
jgi:hypothetical protein